MKIFNRKYQLGLVLSGGGARGLSHLGSVKALLELGYQFDIIAGTSMGAITGCVLANGYHPEEVIQMLTPTVLKSFYKTSVSKNGLMTMKGGRDFLKKILHVKNIEDLKIPFIAAATDIIKGESHYFDKGNIINAVLASASIPVVFSPTVIGENIYVDGGVLNNLPARCIREKCKKIVGFHVNPQSLGLHDSKVDGIYQIAERTFYLAMLGNVIQDKCLCDIFIEHNNLDAYSMFDFEKMQEIVDIGYCNTKDALEKLKKS